jgi:hypothetical protein
MNSGKRMIGSLAIVLLCAAFAPMAWAGPWKYGVAEREQYRQNDFQPGRRGAEPGDGRGPSYRRHDDRDMQRPQRLSPEERSQLRRDIKDAGREIYPPRRR